ncbi:sialomucin core protein 24-like [Limulus polyphemus]|uniref:Sialomucin core protein 24-like n=1 Tax=Limulus polyphemus TaxID=6850 RepID=A0ABM1TDU1_LIMPO|nr:sialomucin core protein 24-like [Limulus polyphemus]
MCPGDLNNISQSALCGHANVDDEVNGFSSDVPNLNVYSTMDQSPSAEILTTSTNDTELPTTTSNAQSTVSAEEITTFSPDISTENKTSSVVSASSPSAAPLSARRFDAPSFIGGIVLSLGFLAILYVGFKFYKAHTERNYHTL